MLYSAEAARFRKWPPFFRRDWRLLFTAIMCDAFVLYSHPFCGLSFLTLASLVKANFEPLSLFIYALSTQSFKCLKHLLRVWSCLRPNEHNRYNIVFTVLPSGELTINCVRETADMLLCVDYKNESHEIHHRCYRILFALHYHITASFNHKLACMCARNAAD